MSAKTVFSKETIIETAFHIAHEDGLEHMTIRQIAKKMGSSIAPIYVNFETIEDLKKAVLEKARNRFSEMLNQFTHEDPFLAYATASIQFSKTYPKLYNAFLLNEDHPSDTIKHVDGMLSVLKENPKYQSIGHKDLISYILSMQAMQVGLSIMARKSYFQDYIDEKALIRLLDETGNTLIHHILHKNKETL
jgi:AcrR family transcriptional regulator